MKAVILAAGLGTRLAKSQPKPLTPIQRENNLLDYQLAALTDLVGKDNIVLVVGYKKELIMERYPEALYVYNPLYAGTNTAKSLLAAVSKIDEDVLWMNGDVFFESPVLKLLIEQPTSSCLVNTARCAEEEIKYTLDAQGHIAALSKQVKDAEGEAVGINLIRQIDLIKFRAALAAVNPKDYFEKALEDMIHDKDLILNAVNIGNYFCREVDFIEDLEDVRKFLQTHPEYAP